MVIQCLLATLSLPVTFLLLTYQREQARAGELMATGNLWTCSDGINPIRCSGSDHTVDKSKALRSFGAFKVILPTAASE